MFTIIFANCKPFVRWILSGIVLALLSTIHVISIVPTAQAFVIFSSFAAFTRQYELDTVYSYSYETSVLLNEPLKVPVSTPKDVGFKFDLQVELIPIWQNPSNTDEQIIELRVKDQQLSVRARQGPTPTSFVNKPSRLNQVEIFSFFFVRDDGVVKKVFYHEKENLSIVNIKKGIASLFQYQLTKDGLRSEVDTSGQCDAFYVVENRNHVKKTKTNCKAIEPTNFFNHTNYVLSADISSQLTTTLDLNEDDTSIRRADTIETHIMNPVARRSSGVEVIAKQSLVLKDKTSSQSKAVNGKTVKSAMEAISKRIKSSLVASSLVTTPDPKECIACRSLQELVGSFRKSLAASNLATQSAAITFLRLLRKLRESNFDEIKKVLVDKKNRNVILQLIDIVAATQTIPAHKAAMSVVKFDNSGLALAERYLLGLSLGTHPLQYVIEGLMKTAKKGLKNEKLAETLVLTIGSMTRTFSHNSGSKKQNIISVVDNFLEKQLENCATESCKLMYIRGMKNRQSKHTVSLLIKHAMSLNKKAAIYAMRAIQSFPDHFINSKTLKNLEKILFELDALHDSSVRVMAAEVLLRGPPQEQLITDIFLMLSKQNSSEINTILLEYISDLCEKRDDMNALVQEVVRKYAFSNYHIYGQGGISSAFSRPLVQDASVNASFINMLEINGGMLKRSIVDVFVSAGDTKSRLLSFGMFAGGLSIFGDSDPEDTEDANAGIEITLFDTQLRPFLLFEGKGELMSHVMSGTASSRTTALQGSMLLQDHSEMVPLQNGLNAEFLLTGAASYDFAGQVQVSLWYRSAESLVEVGSAAVVQGQARVDNGFVQTMIEFNVGSQAQLNFQSNMDFSSEIMMCLQMIQPNGEIVDNVRKLERIPGSNYILRKYKRKSSQTPGKTYVINRKNTEICTKMSNSPS